MSLADRATTCTHPARALFSRAPAPPADRPSNRVTAMDTARALSVFFMLVAAAGLSSGARATQTAAGAAAFAQPFAAPAFFVIAGIFLHRSMRARWLTFATRKLAPLAWRYVLWGGAATLLVTLAKAPPSLSAVFAAVTWLALDPPPALVIILALAISLALARMARGLPILLVLPLAAALEISHTGFGGPIPAAVARYFIYVHAGHAFAPEALQFVRRVTRHRRAAIWALAIFALVEALAVGVGLPLPDSPTLASLPFASLGLGLAGAAAVLTLAALVDDAPEATPARLVGRRSLEVYLAGVLAIEIARFLSPGIAATTLVGLVLCGLGAAFAATGMARRVDAG